MQQRGCEGLIRWLPKREPFTTVVVGPPGRLAGWQSLLDSAREVARDDTVQGFVVLDTAARPSFADFRMRVSMPIWSGRCGRSRC
jgi:hypothetical protein